MQRTIAGIEKTISYFPTIVQYEFLAIHSPIGKADKREPLLNYSSGIAIWSAC